MTVQKRNDQNVSLLSSDFLRLSDPARTLLFTGNESADIPNPPTSPALTTLIDNPENLPDNSMYFAFADNTGKLWLAMVIQDEWYYIEAAKPSDGSDGDTSDGGAVWVDYVPSSVTVNTGTGSGTVADAQVMFDGNTYDVAEAAGVPGYDVEFGFTNVAASPIFVICRWQYDGGSAHDATIDIYNYTSAAWDELRLFNNSGNHFSSMTMYIPQVNAPDYIDGTGNAKIRFYHHSSGNSSHDIHIDHVGLSSSASL